MGHDVGSHVCKFPCGHKFCRECVAEWLDKRCSCPVCRVRVMDEFEIELQCVAGQQLGIKGTLKKVGFEVESVLSKGLAEAWNSDAHSDFGAIERGDFVIEVNGASATSKAVFQKATINGGPVI